MINKSLQELSLTTAETPPLNLLPPGEGRVVCELLWEGILQDEEIQ
jgi:hypothetical protein